MIILLFSIAIFSLLIDMFLMGSVIGYFQKKIKSFDLLRFFMPVVFSFLLLAIGLYSGNQAAKFFSSYKFWYAATILFIFSLKLMYDGSKLSAIKRTINPIDKKGLLYLSILIAINAFFIGLAFGFLELKIVFTLYSFVALYISIFTGYLIGFSLKKLIGFKSDLFFAIIYLLISFFIVIKF
ncbi:MAG: manganese efflux pump [Salinivirgaceae bacterium]|nr:manganese efflux pump [Salinivirgaceae bacterium]